MVTYPSSFSRFRCTVSEKSISEIFSHFPFFSKFMHLLITILLWDMHHDDRNMLSKFQINPLYRLGEMAKTSSGFVTMQQQQLEGADLNVETMACSSDPAKGHLHKEKKSKIISQSLMQSKDPSMQQQNQNMQQKSFTSSHSTSRYVTEPHSSIA